MGKEGKSTLDEALGRIRAQGVDAEARKRQEREKLNQNFEKAISSALANIPVELLELFDNFSNEIQKKYYDHKIERRLFFTGGPLGYFGKYGESDQKIEEHQKVVLDGINNQSIGAQKGFTLLYTEPYDRPDRSCLIKFEVNFNDKKEIKWSVGDRAGEVYQNKEGEFAELVDTLAEMLTDKDFLYVFDVKLGPPGEVCMPVDGPN